MQHTRQLSRAVLAVCETAGLTGKTCTVGQRQLCARKRSMQQKGSRTIHSLLQGLQGAQQCCGTLDFALGEADREFSSQCVALCQGIPQLSSIPRQGCLHDGKLHMPHSLNARDTVPWRLCRATLVSWRQRVLSTWGRGVTGCNHRFSVGWLKRQDSWPHQPYVCGILQQRLQGLIAAVLVSFATWRGGLVTSMPC